MTATDARDAPAAADHAPDLTLRIIQIGPVGKRRVPGLVLAGTREAVKAATHLFGEAVRIVPAGEAKGDG